MTNITTIATHGLFGSESMQIVAMVTHGVFGEPAEMSAVSLAFEKYIRVTTQGRYGVVVFRYMAVTTNGRYDRILGEVPVEITVYPPYLQFANKVPEVNQDVKSPNLGITSR